jgi:hypothetical protein
MIVCHFLLGVCCYMGFPYVAHQRGDSLHLKTDSTHLLVSLYLRFQEQPVKVTDLVLGLTHFISLAQLKNKKEVV